MQATTFASVREWATALVAGLTQNAAVPARDRATLQSQLLAMDQDHSTLPSNGPVDPLIVRNLDSLKQLATTLGSEPALALDLETSHIDPRKGEIVGVGLATVDKTYYIPTGHRSGPDQRLLPDQIPAGEVARLLALDKLPVVAHNAKFELKWLRYHAGVTIRIAWDSMLAAKLLRSELPASLKEVAQRELDALDWGLSAQEMKEIQYLPIDRVARYCAKDVYYTLKLMQRQKACFN
jgi:DNA polymerase I-like protein with 3'-5' exonuclease and polymerase domains